MKRPSLRRWVVLGVVPAVTACTATTFSMPSYEPRPVAIPAECATLIARAADDGMARLSETERQTVAFCQQQQLVRAAEEESAAARREADARTASLAVQVGTVVLGATIAVLAWVF